jgi:hypothetical protein
MDAFLIDLGPLAGLAGCLLPYRLGDWCPCPAAGRPLPSVPVLRHDRAPFVLWLQAPSAAQSPRPDASRAGHTRRLRPDHDQENRDGARQPSRQLAERLADALELSGEERGLLLGAPEGGATGLAGLPAAPAPAATPGTPPGLPAPPGPPLGRSRDLAALRALLTGGTTRLVTLTGPGGVGKTRLALQLAADLQDVFVDGIWFVGKCQN